MVKINATDSEMEKTEETVCPVCGMRKTVVSLDPQLGIFRCPACSHVFGVVAKEKQEQYKDNYFLKDHKNWFENPDYKLFGYLYKKIKKFNNSDKLSILDAGCGIGTFLKYIAKREPDARLVGIDLISNEFSGIRFIKGDILNEEIGETFNVACGIVVAEHIEYPEILVKNIRRVLKPGGTFIITTLNDDGLIYSIARFLKKAGIRSAYDRIYSTHNLQYYTGRSLRWLVEANGFDVVCHERHNYSLRSVDVPGGSVFVRAFYKTVTAAIFLLSNMVGKQLLQTIVCKKRKE